MLNPRLLQSATDIIPIYQLIVRLRPLRLLIGILLLIVAGHILISSFGDFSSVVWRNPLGLLILVGGVCIFHLVITSYLGVQGYSSVQLEKQNKSWDLLLLTPRKRDRLLQLRLLRLIQRHRALLGGLFLYLSLTTFYTFQLLHNETPILLVGTYPSVQRFLLLMSVSFIAILDCCHVTSLGLMIATTHPSRSWVTWVLLAIRPLVIIGGLCVVSMILFANSLDSLYLCIVVSTKVSYLSLIKLHLEVSAKMTDA